MNSPIIPKTKTFKKVSVVFDNDDNDIPAVIRKTSDHNELELVFQDEATKYSHYKALICLKGHSSPVFYSYGDGSYYVLVGFLKVLQIFKKKIAAAWIEIEFDINIAKKILSEGSSELINNLVIRA